MNCRLWNRLVTGRIEIPIQLGSTLCCRFPSVNDEHLKIQVIKLMFFFVKFVRIKRTLTTANRTVETSRIIIVNVVAAANGIIFAGRWTGLDAGQDAWRCCCWLRRCRGAGRSNRLPTDEGIQQLVVGIRCIPIRELRIGVYPGEQQKQSCNR